MTYLYVVAGAMAGAPLRYFIGSHVKSGAIGPFPLGTFLINVSGCLAIGILLGLAETRDGLSREVRLLLVTGFLGSYTTFSAFGWETQDMLRDNDVLPAMAYAGLSLALGVGAAWIGAALVRAAS